MKPALLGILCAALGVGGGAAGGYAYSAHHHSDSADNVYCYNPHPGGHLNGAPSSENQVCVPTGR